MIEPHTFTSPPPLFKVSVPVVSPHDAVVGLRTKVSTCKPLHINHIEDGIFNHSILTFLKNNEPNEESDCNVNSLIGQRRDLLTVINIPTRTLRYGQPPPYTTAPPEMA